MPKYLIERTIPGAGKLSPVELKGIAEKSCDVLKIIGSGIQWRQSYVTDDKITCIYYADNEQLLKDHAQKGGFPADRICRIEAILDPSVAESYA